MINKSYSSLSDQEAISGASGVFRGWSLVSVVLGTFSFVIGIAALPLRLILRNNIGERSVRPFSFILAIAIHIYYFIKFSAFVGFISILGVAGDPFKGMGHEALLFMAIFVLINPYAVFLLWSIIRAVKHFRAKIREAHSGEVGYTYYRGESRFFADWNKPTINGFTTNPKTIRMLAEPKAVGLIGLSISFASVAIIFALILLFNTESALLMAIMATLFTTGIIVFLDAICLAIDEISLELNRRDKILDMLDSEEDAKYLIAEKEQTQAKRKNIDSNRREGLNEDSDLESDFVVD